jgi:hypothetical protein
MAVIPNEKTGRLIYRRELMKFLNNTIKAESIFFLRLHNDY